MNGIIPGLDSSLRLLTRKPDDGRIGLPLDLYTYIKGEPTAAPPVVLYVVGTNTERVGTDSDESIVSGLLADGFTVVVADYGGNPAASGHELDWSLQQLRNRIDGGYALDGTAHAKYCIYILPSGYSLTLDIPYWAIDRHGSDGTLDRIVNIWNNDFRSVKGDRTITYPDGRTVRVGDVEAKTIYDCVKPDGSPIDLNHYLDLIYPTHPKKPVPVMAVSSSSQTRIESWTMAPRPHLTGFLFAGYAGAAFDYGYTPMARDDHYGYFDGYPCKAAVTGDNYTYSIGVFNGAKSEPAAIRRIRWLADRYPDVYNFDREHIGVYGNSKGGLCTRLGTPDTDRLPEQRLLPGHHGETRFENGLTEDDGQGIIRGATEQPWLTYLDGTKIPGNVQFVYANCGGQIELMIPGHAPTYLTGSMKDGSYFGFYPTGVNQCRVNGTPSLHFRCSGLGHGLSSGPDADYGVDTYEALFDIAHYWLSDAPAVCEFISVEDAPLPTVKIAFSGPVPAEEISRVSVTADGNPLPGEWSALYGETEWTFTADACPGGATVSVTVPDDVRSANGKPIRAGKTATHLYHEETVSPISDGILPEGNTLRVHIGNDAVNRLLALADGEEFGRITVSGKGIYELALPETAVGKRLELRPEKTPGVNPVFACDFTRDPSGLVFDPLTVGEISEDGAHISYMVPNDNKFSPWIPNICPAVSFPDAFGSTPFTPDDAGRRFVIALSLVDTTSRFMRLTQGKVAVRDRYDSIDFHANMQTVRTEPNKPTEISFEYTARGDEVETLLEKTTVRLSAEAGTKECPRPFTVTAFGVNEIVTAVEIGTIEVVTK